MCAWLRRLVFNIRLSRVQWPAGWRGDLKALREGFYFTRCGE